MLLHFCCRTFFSIIFCLLFYISSKGLYFIFLAFYHLSSGQIWLELLPYGLDFCLHGILVRLLIFWFVCSFFLFLSTGTCDIWLLRKSEKLTDSMIVGWNGMIRFLLDAQSLLENCQMLIVKGNLAQINRMLTIMLYLSPASY